MIFVIIYCTAGLLVLAGVVAAFITKQKENKPRLCDSCKWLRTKRKEDRRTYRYDCAKECLSFTQCPEYCDRYQKREEQRDG